MEFATLGARPPRPLGEPEPALPTIASSTARVSTLALTLTPGDLARPVLPRLMCVSGSRRSPTSTDRLSDVHLLGDAHRGERPRRASADRPLASSNARWSCASGRLIGPGSS